MRIRLAPSGRLNVCYIMVIISPASQRAQCARDHCPCSGVFRLLAFSVCVFSINYSCVPIIAVRPRTVACVQVTSCLLTIHVASSAHRARFSNATALRLLTCCSKVRMLRLLLGKLCWVLPTDGIELALEPRRLLVAGQGWFRLRCFSQSVGFPLRHLWHRWRRFRHLWDRWYLWYRWRR